MDELEEMVKEDINLSKTIDGLVRHRMALVEEEIIRLSKEHGTSKLPSKEG